MLRLPEISPQRDVVPVVAHDQSVTVTATLDDPLTPIIHLAGELDLASVESTQADIATYLSDESVRVTFDLQDLTFMDSSGIAMLVQISNDVGQVTLINVSPIVRRVLEVTGLVQHFGLDP
jgi:anti-sigma B factor antagonist